MITVPAPNRPERALSFQCCNDGGVIGYRDGNVERAKPGLMRHDLCDRERPLSVLCELGPILLHPIENIPVVFLQRVEQTCACDALGGRPHQHDRVWSPRLLPVRVAKAAFEFKNRLTVLPDRDRCPQLAVARKVFVKERRDFFAKLLWVQSHA